MRPVKRNFAPVKRNFAPVKLKNATQLYIMLYSIVPAKNKTMAEHQKGNSL